MRLLIQVADMSLVRIAGFSLRDMMKSAVIQQRVRLELLHFHIERSQLKRFGHLTRMASGQLLIEVLWEYPTGRWPQGRTRTGLRY